MKKPYRTTAAHAVSTPLRRARRLASVLLLAALLAAALAPSASAHQVRLLSGSFGTATSNPADPYPLTGLGFFEGPASVAVDRSSGDFYVADPVNHRVEKFDSSGHFILTFGKEVNKTKVEAAAPGPEQNLCTLASGDVCQPGTSGTSPGAFSGTNAGSLFLAVDNSADTSRGDVYVADGSARLISKFASSGYLVESWGDKGPLGAPNGQFDGADAGGEVTGPFNSVDAIGVDAAGDLWVYGLSASRTFSEVFEFDEDAGFKAGWHSPGGAFGGHVISFDEAGNLFLGEIGEIGKYSPSGERFGRVFASFAGVASMAIDPVSGDLFLLSNFSTEIVRIAASCQPGPATSCEPVESFPVGNGNLGIAFGTVNNALYVADAEAGAVHAYAVSTVPDVVTKRPSGVSPSTATLNGTVNPDGTPLTECFFEWGETESYGAVAECEPSAAALGAGSSPVAVHAQISVQPGHTYHYRLRAANANDVSELIDQPEEGADLAFGPPVVEATFSTDVAASSATLHAEVNPRNVPVRVHLEYGLAEGAYEHTTPVVEVPAGGAAVDVSAHVSGLDPHTTYHFRAVAESVLAEGPAAVLGPDTALTTQPLASFPLPDRRGWEMVSPPEKLGASFNSINGFQGVIQASAEGDAIAYLASGPTEASVPGYENKVQVISARGPSGWSSRDIPLPNLAASGASVGAGYEYRAFSTDLSRGLVQPFGPFDPSISAQATEQTPYLRGLLSPAGSVCTLDCYRPLFTHAEGAADVPTGIRFGISQGTKEPCPPSPRCGPVFVGASPDLSHDVVEWHLGGLTETPGDEGGLYEWSAGAPPSESVRLISVSPNGHPLKNATAPTLGTSYALGIADAVSTDGSRVVFSENSGGVHLYLRDNATAPQSASGACDEAGRACTIQLDLKQPGASGQGGVNPVFQAASADGSRLFFTDQQQLTPGSGAANESPDLYECHLLEDEEGHTRCALTDLTPESGGEAADVQGGVIGVAEDGSNVYFVADGVLAHNRNLAGEEAAPGSCLQEQNVPLGATCNLYRYRPGEGIAFIAALPALDRPDWDIQPQGRPARVSPDGRWLAFMSERSLTGYDNRDAAGGEAAEEVFLYHATGAGGTLVCASCNPTGARPRSVEWKRIDENHGGIAGGSLGFFGDRQIAAIVPGWTDYENTKSLHQSRYLSDSGRLFFDAFDALLPSDTNGTMDVYEYEPPQGGEAEPSEDTCTAASPAYSPASAGCLGLISSGTSPSESAFLDASESGDDVFFLTAARLSPRDEDIALDVYDARVGGGEAVPTKPVICQGDACQQPATAPNDATPGSLSFDGPGNEQPPGKPNRHEPPNRHKPRKHKPHRHKRAHHKRGGRR